MKAKWLVLLLIPLVSYQALAKEKVELKSQKQKFSYTVGFQVGMDFKRKGINLDSKAFVRAIQDVMSGSKPRLSQEAMQTAMQNYRSVMMQKRKALAEGNLKKGDAFLAANKKKKGVVALPSGLQYSVIKKGKGKSPKSTDTVEVHYRGTLIDGKEFDSSYRKGKPVVFPVNGVIKGWQEALPLMKEGAKWNVVIPADLAYGPRGSGPMIGPNAALVFDIELVAVK